MLHRYLFVVAYLATGLTCVAQIPEDGAFRWRVGSPLLKVDPARLPESPEHPWIAVKDPSVVRYGERWHLFCTLRKNKQGNGRIRIGYLSFDHWENAKSADWSVLRLTMEYHGAPQIFWFEPHEKWYLIYQAEDQVRGLKYGPCYSTNDDITKPEQWTLPEPLYVVPKGMKAGLDFWVICDDAKAHLFYTSLDGRMWRAETSLASFPNKDWSKPRVALKADIFEASHTYKLAGQERFLTVVETQENRRRYFKAFIADSLEGEWKPLDATRDKPLVSPVNVVNQADSWATSYSHGEFLRSGYNQHLEIDPENMQLLFQGASDDEYHNRNYGQIPWKLGLLTRTNLERSSTPTNELKDRPGVPAGISAGYSRDIGIETHPSVIFAENFEQHDLNLVGERWETFRNADIMSLSNDVPQASSGKRSLLMSQLAEKGNGAALYRSLEDGYEKLFTRMYVKFADDCEPVHHFGACVGGNNPSTRWPVVRAGQPTKGDTSFWVGIEPFGKRWTWDYYAYWCDMRGSPPRGQTWGNKFIRDESLKVRRGGWTCIEVMVQMNDVGDTNGELALWIDGRQVSHLGKGFPRGKWTFDKFNPGQEGEGVRWNHTTGDREFFKTAPGGDPYEGFRFRTTKQLNVNFVWLYLHLTSGTPGHTNRVWFDDIVVAKEYIGPINPKQAVGNVP